MDVLRDSVWQFVGAAVAVVALFVSIGAALVQRRRKKLEFRILTNTPVLTVREELAGRLRVLLDEEPVEDLSLVVIEVANRGNIPIRTVDFEVPVTFRLGRNSKILSAEVTSKRPADLAPEISIADSALTITHLVLNSSDSFTFKCLVTRAEGVAVARGRVVGVTQIREFSSAHPRYQRVMLFAGMSIVAAAVWLAGYLADHSSGARDAASISLIVTVDLIGSMLIAFGLPDRLN